MRRLVKSAERLQAIGLPTVIAEQHSNFRLLQGVWASTKTLSRALVNSGARLGLLELNPTAPGLPLSL